MSQFKREQFTKEQYEVIINPRRLNELCDNLHLIASREDLSLKNKRFDMFKMLISYMSIRKQEFVYYGIKSNVANKLVKQEIKSLNDFIKELKNVIQ